MSPCLCLSVQAVWQVHINTRLGVLEVHQGSWMSLPCTNLHMIARLRVQVHNCRP